MGSMGMETKPNSKLNVIVDTFDKAGELVGTRTVDLYHYGTRDWLAKHNWWAMHNDCTVNQRPDTLTE